MFSKTHQCTDHSSDRRHARENTLEPVRVAPKRAGKDGPVDSRDRIDAQFHHDSREEHANRTRRYSVSIRQPEMKRNDRGFDHVSNSDQQKCEQNKSVGMGAQRTSDLRKIQRAGSRVQQANAADDHESSNGVHDGKVESALQRSRFESLESAECERRDTHQLKEDEEIEEVTRVTESAHRSHEDQHQWLKVIFGIFKNLP